MDVSFLYVLLPRYGIIGYFLSFLVTHVINFILSIRRLTKISKIQIPWYIPMFTISAGLASAWTAGFVSHSLLRAATYVVLLFCLLFLSKVLNAEDLKWIKGLVYKK